MVSKPTIKTISMNRNAAVHAKPGTRCDMESCLSPVLYTGAGLVRHQGRYHGTVSHLAKAEQKRQTPIVSESFPRLGGGAIEDDVAKAAGIFEDRRSKDNA
jgi:hypothetical protein